MIDKYLDLARELNKAVEHRGDGDSTCSWCGWNGVQRPGKETGRTENQNKNRRRTDCSSKIG